MTAEQTPPATLPPAIVDTPAAGAPGGLAQLLFGRWLRPPLASDYDWQQDAHAAFLGQQPLRARALLYAIALVVMLLIVWAALASIDEVTRGQGKVIPSRQIQVVQSQDGGVVTELLVREGDVVREGQLLVRLDQTRSESTFRENQAELQALTIRSERLRAVADGTGFDPSSRLRLALPDIITQELQLYESSKARLLLEQQIAQEQLVQRQAELAEVKARSRQLARSLELTNSEMNVTRPMVASGAVSQIEILRLEREVNQLSGEHEQSLSQIERLASAIAEARRKLSEVELGFINKVREDLADTISRMNSLVETGTGLSDRVKQTEVRSPVNGTVKQLYYNTIGGVVLPGKEIIEIVPTDDSLLLEVRIRPKDIAFLVPGQTAMVKFTAYDFVVYGGLDGVVEHIGVDTITDEEGNPFYEIYVRTNASGVGENMPIIPGMMVEADIVTGRKTILAYLMKPVLRARQYAMTER